MSNTSSSQISPNVFQFNHTFLVRVIVLDSEPWFCLSDVCKILDVDRTSNLIKSLDKKGWVKNQILTEGGKQQLVFISEPNLYRVIFRSNKPEAKQFQDWVFNEVLPAIRKTGTYQADSNLAEPPSTITPQQRKQLAAACRNVFTAWCWSSENTQYIYNRIRAQYNLDRVEDLPADRFEEVMAMVGQIGEMNSRAISVLCDLRDEYLQQYVGAGAPWTPGLKRKWRQKVGTRFPDKPDWLEIQRTLGGER